MVVKSVKDTGNMFIACSGYPKCKNTMSLPRNIVKATMLPNNCSTCVAKRK